MKLTAFLFVSVACYFVFAATPNEEAARQQAIKQTAAAIEAECQSYANGDWNAWYKQLAPFRENLHSEIVALAARKTAFESDHTAPSPLLRIEGHPTLFGEPDGALYVAGAFEPPSPEAWMSRMPAIEAIKRVSQWLRKMQIDLILVPVPKMAEVYADKLYAGKIPGGIAAPQMRRMILELLRSDVEVVDLLPTFLKERNVDPEALYLPADSHWSDRAQRIAARQIAERMGRYEFVKAAKAKPSQFQALPIEMLYNGSNFALLNPVDVKQLQPYVAHTKVTKITANGVPFKEPKDSPLVVIGDSYTHYFQLVMCPGSGIDALVSRDVNTSVSNVSAAGATTAPVKDFLRDPELLRHRRAVIWIVTNAILSYDSFWDLPKLPDNFLAK